MMCPHCKNEDKSMMEWISVRFTEIERIRVYLCACCAKTFEVKCDAEYPPGVAGKFNERQES